MRTRRARYPEFSSPRFLKLVQNRLEGACLNTCRRRSPSRASSAWRATRETRPSSSSAATKRIFAIGISNLCYTLATMKVQSKQTWKLRKLCRWHGLQLQLSFLTFFLSFFSLYFFFSISATRFVKYILTVSWIQNFIVVFCCQYIFIGLHNEFENSTLESTTFNEIFYCSITNLIFTILVILQ